MIAVCPNCRHSYQNDLHSVCQPCYDDRTLYNKQTILSAKTRYLGPTCDVSMTKQKLQRNRKFTSNSGNMRNNEDLPTDKTSNKKDDADDDQRVEIDHSPTPSLSFIIEPSKEIEKRSINENELMPIVKTQKYLKMSGWYHGQLTWKAAMTLLMPTSVGTFLVRDSSDPNYLYSISVQTKCGPTSLRLYYGEGEFRLDADHIVAKYLPKFACLIELIQFYVESTKQLPIRCRQDNENQNWTNCVGEIFSNIVVSKPLYAKDNFPSLKHLARLCINRNLVDPSFVSVLSAPLNVRKYLEEYPYKI